MEKPECKIIGEDGNVFNLIGIAKKTLRREGLTEELEAFSGELEDVMRNGGSYDDVLVLIMKYVDVI